MSFVYVALHSKKETCPDLRELLNSNFTSQNGDVLVMICVPLVPLMSSLRREVLTCYQTNVLAQPNESVERR